MINKDAVVIGVVALHCLIFIVLLAFTEMKYLVELSSLTTVIWGSLLVLSKRITKLNVWYEMPFGQTK
jgi:hypothetical protein